MSEESDLEKTESATPKRLEKAREEGQVARSRELASFALLAAGFFGVWGLSGPISGHLQSILRGAFTFNHETVLDTRQMMIGAANAGKEGMLAVLPVLALTAVAALAAPMALGGWLITTKPLAPNFGRLNPVSGLGKIFSSQGPIQLGMSILKTIVVGGMAGSAMWSRKAEVLGLLTKPLGLALADVMHLIVVCCGMAIGGLFLVAAVDVPYQMWSHAKETDARIAGQWALLCAAARRAKQGNNNNGVLIRTRMEYNRKALAALQVAPSKAGFYGPDGRVPGA